MRDRLRVAEKDEYHVPRLQEEVPCAADLDGGDESQGGPAERPAAVARARQTPRLRSRGATAALRGPRCPSRSCDGRSRIVLVRAGFHCVEPFRWLLPWAAPREGALR